jgi:hypothetical protein
MTPRPDALRGVGRGPEVADVRGSEVVEGYEQCGERWSHPAQT